MKKAIIIIVIILCSVSLYSAEPVVKFYLQDGSSKQYKISEIGNFDFIKSNLSFSMRTYSRNKGTTDYDIRSIDSVSLDSSKISIAIPGNVFTENLWEIDSIIFVWNTCEEIQIVYQIWMCRNLDVDHYRNGDSIPEVRDYLEWGNIKTGAWCYYNNDPAMGTNYGKLYNWYAVNDSRGLAPTGWHVPSDLEWTTLITYLGGDSIAGSKLKETGTTHWKSPNHSTTNQSSFSALPGGNRHYSGIFVFLGWYGNWWSSSIYNSEEAWYRTLYYDSATIGKSHAPMRFGFSVRCIKY